MPIKATPDLTNSIVYTTLSGTITLTDIEDHQLTFWASPELFACSELVDFDSADFSQISYGDLLTITQLAAKVVPPNPEAGIALVTHTEEHINIANFYISAKSMATGRSREVRSFNCKEQAMSWLTSRTDNHAEARNPDALSTD